MKFIGKHFVSMRVKFVAAAIITGLSAILSALAVVFAALHGFRHINKQGTLGDDIDPALAADLIVLGGILLAILLFLLVMLIYYHHQIRAIVVLSGEVRAVSEGKLESAISAARNDEIGQLAGDVNLMRRTILEKMAEREAAWQVNSDLLTSMTHDIRTPLTTLLGYMDLLGKDNENLTEEQRSYVRICTQKAAQIKGLSDKLFLYFWAYNRADSEGESPTEYECSLLLEQLIGDYIPAMEAVGLSISADLSAIRPEDQVAVPIDSLRRVTDNLFDNAAKYADPQSPVCIIAERADEQVKLCFSNAVGPRREHTSGTRIGTKTCACIMEQLNGHFETFEEDSRFTAILTLPLCTISLREQKKK